MDRSTVLWLHPEIAFFWFLHDSMTVAATEEDQRPFTVMDLGQGKVVQ